MPQIRVAIDANTIVGPRAGVGRYTLELISALAELDDGPELTCIVGTTIIDSLRTLGGVSRKRSLFDRVVQRGLRLLGPYADPAECRYNEFSLNRQTGRALTRVQPHVVHGPNNDVVDFDGPRVMTVHDISCFTHPENHPKARVAWQARRLPKLIDRVHHVLTVSEFSKAEIRRWFGTPESKITVTPNGVNSVFAPRDQPATAATLRKYLLEYGKYVLTVGTIEPRKNLGTLALAHAALPDNIQVTFPLVVIGLLGRVGTNAWGEADARPSMERSIRSGRIRVLGYVPDSDLPDLFAGAKVFAYPSVYEGFGLPPLEAMASGVPTIVAGRASLPEVVDDAGLILDAFDHVAWAEALQSLIEEGSLREALLTKGITRARRFDWKATARLTNAVYQRLVV